MPMRFDGNGEAIAWGPKRLGPLLAPLAVGFVMCAMMPLIAWQIARGLRRPDAARPEAVALHRRRFRAVRETLIGASWLLGAVFLAVATLQLVSDPRSVQLATIGTIVLGNLGGIGLIVVLLVRHGSAFTASSRGPEAATAGSPIGDRTDDRFWKWGVFYFNRDDPATWVEKRIGIGYTFNFARPAAWWTLLALVAGPLAVVALVLALL